MGLTTNDRGRFFSLQIVPGISRQKAPLFTAFGKFEVESKLRLFNMEISSFFAAVPSWFSGMYTSYWYLNFFSSCLSFSSSSSSCVIAYHAVGAHGLSFILFPIFFYFSLSHVISPSPTSFLTFSLSFFHSSGQGSFSAPTRVTYTCFLQFFASRRKTLCYTTIRSALYQSFTTL